MNELTILILGEFRGHDPIHRATRQAVRHAAEAEGVLGNTRWLGTEALALYPGAVAESSAVVLIPPALPDSHTAFAPLLSGLGSVRDEKIPFLATGEAHGLVFVELGRSVLGMEGAGSTEWKGPVPDPVVAEIPGTPGDESPRPIALELLDDALLSELGYTGSIEEQTDVRHGLSPDYAHALEDAGLAIIGVAPGDRRPYLHRLVDSPFHVTAAFLPQLRTEENAPHPLFRGLIRAARARGEGQR